MLEEETGSSPSSQMLVKLHNGSCQRRSTREHGPGRGGKQETKADTTSLLEKLEGGRQTEEVRRRREAFGELH